MPFLLDVLFPHHDLVPLPTFSLIIKLDTNANTAKHRQTIKLHLTATSYPALTMACIFSFNPSILSKLSITRRTISFTLSSSISSPSISAMLCVPIRSLSCWGRTCCTVAATMPKQIEEPREPKRFRHEIAVARSWASECATIVNDDYTLAS